MKLNLPKKIEALMDADFFTQDDLVDDTMLYKMELYVPAIIEAIDLVVADLKDKRGRLQNDLWYFEQATLPQKQAEILLMVDPKRYTNTDLRQAKIEDNKSIKDVKLEMLDLKQEITGLDSEINRWLAKTWRYKNLQNNLDNISKLRISERKY